MTGAILRVLNDDECGAVVPQVCGCCGSDMKIAGGYYYSFAPGRDWITIAMSCRACGKCSSQVTLNANDMRESCLVAFVDGKVSLDLDVFDHAWPGF